MMKVLVTGSSGHLGEALVRTLRDLQYEVAGFDILESPFTTHVGSITDRSWVRRCMRGVQAVFHAATLHKPHVATHSRHDFVDTNVTGTLNLLEEAVAAGVEGFVYTSTTSVFGAALAPPREAPAAWITEEVTPIPEKHLWRDQSGSGRAVRVVPSRPGRSLHRAENLTLLPRRR